MRAYGYLLGVVIIWGLAYPLTKYLTAYFSPTFIAFFRAAIGFAVLSAVAKPARPDGKTAAVGILNMGATVLLINLSLLFAKSPGLVSTLMYTQPLFVLLLSAIALKATVKLGEALGVALGVAGVIVSTMGGGACTCDLLPVLGGFLWALGTVAYKLWLTDKPVLPITATMNGVAAAFLLPTALVSYKVSFSARALLLLIALAVLAQGVAWLLWFRSIRELGPVRAGEISLLVPVFSYLFSYFMLGSTPTLYQAIGSALILSGISTIYIAAGKFK